MELIRTTSYAKGVKRLRKLGASEADILGMENEIAANPEVGALIPGSGGLRKVRFGFAGTGERGGGRTIYYTVADDETIYLLVTYPKADRSDLTKTELKLFSKLARELTDG